jgi:hypothetical protein
MKTDFCSGLNQDSKPDIRSAFIRKSAVLETSFQKRASALVVTLLIIVVLSTIVVAFMQSMSLERKTAQSYKNAYLASLASDSAQVEALGRISYLMANNPYHAIGYTNVGGQILPLFQGLGNYTDTAVSASEYLISTNVSASLTALDSTNSIAINRATADTTGWMGSPVTNGAIAYREARAPWAYLLKDPTIAHQPDPSASAYNPYISRYAYWVEDETSKIDFQVAGNNSGGSGAFERTNSAVAPRDVDLGALPLLNDASVPTTDNTLNNTLITFRDSVVNLPPDFRVVARTPGISTDGEAASRYYRTLAGYSNDLSGMGRRRANLNAIVTDSSDPSKIKADLDDIIYVISGVHPFTGLANISDNGNFIDLSAGAGPLPNFGDRFYSGATAAHKEIYMMKVAANIRDYVDADSQPTLVAYNGDVPAAGKPTVVWGFQGDDVDPVTTEQPQAIGKEAIPYIQEFAWAGFEETWSGTGTTRTGTIEIDYYLEFYNPATKNFVAPTGTFIKLHDLPEWDAGSYPYIEPADFELDVSGLTFPAGQATVITTQPSAANDPSGLIQSGGPVYRITPSTGDLSRRFENRSTDEDISSTPGFQLIPRSTTVTDYRTKMVFGGSNGYYDSFPFVSISMGSSAPFNFKGEQVGNRQRFVYGSSLRGNDASSRSGDPRSLSEQIRMAPYGTASSDTSRFYGSIQGTGSIPGTSSFAKGVSTYINPTSWPDYNPALDDTSSTAYAVVRDGAMQSIGELGNIYDPRRVSGPGGILYARGGGRTLKIGQQDDVIGSSVRFSSGWQIAAWRLTDAFSADANTTQPLADSQGRGKININSVIRDDGFALRALLRKISMLPSPESDKIMAGNDLTDTEIDELIASLQTYITTNGPLMERGEISQIEFFSSTGTTTAGGGLISTAADRGREELCRRLIEMITTRSSSFSVFAVGQAIRETAAGTIIPLATSRQASVFRMDPEMSGTTLTDTATTFNATHLYDIP